MRPVKILMWAAPVSGLLFVIFLRLALRGLPAGAIAGIAVTASVLAIHTASFLATGAALGVLARQRRPIPPFFWFSLLYTVVACGRLYQLVFGGTGPGRADARTIAALTAAICAGIMAVLFGLVRRRKCF